MTAFHVPFLEFHVEEWTGVEWRTIAVFWRHSDALFFCETWTETVGRDEYRITVDNGADQKSAAVPA